MQLSEYHKQDSFFLIAGPCAIEDEQTSMQIAEHLIKISSNLNIPFVFKGSYRKANRTSLKSFTGIGDEKALKILAKVKAELGCSVLTDIHESDEALRSSTYVLS